MSRCFPFPPPGYEKNNHGSGGESGGATGLLFTIKIKKSAEEERRKEKKRQKKERKEKKSRKHGKVEGGKHASNKRQKDKRGNIGDKVTRIEQEGEHLENSGLTEEHGNPTRCPNSCDSLDSIDDGGKRKKQKVDQDASHDFGNRLFLRLPSLKSKEQQGTNEQPCSSDSKIISRLERIETTTTTATKPSSFQTVGSERPESSSRTSGTEITLFRDLIENWVPPIQRECAEIDNQEWLFEKQQQHHKQENRWKGSAQTGNGVSGFWSCSACYLPEAGIYALPFTIPY